MKKILWIIIALMFLFACEGGNNSNPIESKNVIDELSNTDLEKSSSTQGAQTDDRIIEARKDYQIVIQDEDRWEIMLNFRKAKKIPYQSDSLYTYQGHLIYKLSYYIIKGRSTAIYDPRINTFTVCAEDDAGERGKIIYSFILDQNNKNNLIGNYHYHESPYRLNSIPATFIQGRDQLTSKIVPDMYPE